jgi:TonB-dependent starch-binding outer membrane protein SusC
MRRIFTSWKYYRALFTIVMISLASIASAQERTVSGTITSSEDGEPLPGVSIIIDKTQTGTITDLDGSYSLEVAGDNAVLNFSFIGFKAQSVNVGGKSVINLEMQVDLTALDEVVVVGYGSIKKSDLTGSVSSVKSADISAFPAISAVQTLQGRASGVQISGNNGGAPGTDFSIRVRGTNSVNASSEPLRVVDGFVGGEMPPPEDIESIEILKDASSTAIYGSRGSNGVIMVTTKRGKVGKPKVIFNSSYSLQETTNKLDLLDGQQFATYMKNFAPNYEYLGSNTDWQDVIYRKGMISNNQLSVSGGSEEVRYYLSGNYFDQQGIVIGSDYNRYTLNANMDIKASKFLKIGTSMYGRRTSDIGIRTQEGSGGSGQAGVVGAAMRFNPDLGIYKEDGTFTVAQVGDQIDNPYAMATQYKRERLTDRFQTNSYADFTILKWLSFKSTLGLGMTNWRDGEYWPTTLIRGKSIGGTASIDAQKQTSILNENYFTISKEIGKHNIVWVNGYSYQKNMNESWGASSSGFLNNSSLYWALSQGALPNAPSSSYSESTITSYYSRLNYSLMERYSLTLTARQDGASNFAADNKWAFFPSMAAAWDVKGESFMKSVSQIEQLKLRVSYGSVGNQAIGSYQSLASLSVRNPHIAGTNALGVGALANSKLSWETTTQFDVGLDIALFKGRVSITTDYYNKQTKDLLFRRTLPSYIGVGSQWQNIGTLENKGFEFAVNSKNLVKELKWSTDFNISFNRNKIVDLADSVQIYGTTPGHMLLGSSSQLLLEGQPIGVFYGYQYEGVYQNGDTFIPGAGFEQTAGGEKFADLSGADGTPDGKLSNLDRTIIGNPNPDFTWGFNNTFSYKGFDLNIFIQGSHGNDMLNFTAMELETLSGKANASKVALRAWTAENPNTDIPKASSGRTYKVSSRWVYDASYVRVKNIILGYNIPSSLIEKAGIRTLKLYVSAQNLFTFTDYPGLDPEVNYQNSSSNIGLDYGSYPNVRSFTFGVNLGL